MALDFKALLDKYIDHVGICEGTSFLRDMHFEQSSSGRYGETITFTDEEKKYLQTGKETKET